jgi:DNA repair protein RadC
MAINDWLKNERPREKLLLKGTNALSDAELLAILLRTGVKGKTAIDLARDLLTTTGGLRQLLESEQKVLCKYHGIGIAKYAQIQAALELAKRHLYQNLIHRDALVNSTETKKYLISRLRHQQREVFACLFLNINNKIIDYAEMFYGTINTSAVHPREVVKKALNCNAASVIFAHNHPSGVAIPSSADKKLTIKLAKSLSLVDIRSFDHIIIGEGTAFSFAENGLM